MRCTQFRTALSARLDGEPAGLPERRLDSHLARCAGCREWQAGAERLRGLATAEGPAEDWAARLVAGLRQGGGVGHGDS